MKTPIKWVGSKKKLINNISKKIPQKINNYFELFAGSAVMLFHLEHPKSFISDINLELINFYKVLKDSPQELIKEVKNIQITEENYYKIRNWDREPNWISNWTELQRATRFLFLNRTCFNGVWRINSKGYFNTPYGKKNEVQVDFKEETLKKASEFLKNVNIFCEDFEFFLPMIKENDLVYLDPPYAINKNSGQSSYNQKDFLFDEQIRLKNFCKKLNSQNTKFILSNSYSEEIIELYKDFSIDIINVKRCVGSTKESRKNVQEVLVSNT